MNTNAKIFVSIIILLVFGVVLTVLLRLDNPTAGAPGKYDEFAVCLKDKGAVFYGTFWCKYCNAQKKMFDVSQRLLPYVECSLPSGQGQTQVCIEKDIKGYPTWEFADGSRLQGVLSFEQLAEKTACAVPQ